MEEGPQEGTHFKRCCERSCQGIMEGGGDAAALEGESSWAANHEGGRGELGFFMSSSFVPESPICECPSGKKQQVTG